MPEEDKSAQSMMEALQEKELLLTGARAEVAMLTRQLEEASLRLEAAREELESFSYSISHDLRAPLRAMNGNAEILLEDFGDQLTGGAGKCVKRIRENASRMERLINGLLSFSQIGRKELRKSSVDMTALARSVFDELAEHRPHSAHVVLHPMPEAYGDYTMLQTAWTNLISNAIKFSAQKKDPVIEVGAETSGDVAKYYIRDNGAGFDMAYAGNLFGTFQRLHDDTEFEGVGIGLAITRRIIVKHGGGIQAQAAPGQGATFSFTLGA